MQAVCVLQLHKLFRTMAEVQNAPCLLCASKRIVPYRHPGMHPGIMR